MEAAGYPTGVRGEHRARWPRETPAECARRLDISKEAAELFSSSDVIDLHIDSFIWQRSAGYRLDVRHGAGLFGARYASQVDFPRLRQVGLTGATWVITTNPFRTAKSRHRTFKRNLSHLERTLDAHPNDLVRVATADEYEHATRAGLHAAFVGVQGGNAFGNDPEAILALDSRRLLRVTLTHLTKSPLGQTSSPLGGSGKGLSNFGADVVRLLNQKRIFVDLAHIDRQGFFDALAAHDTSLPPIVTHTGVAAVHAHWRNIDDEQIRAIADRGGTIGIMYHTPFLGSGWGRLDLTSVVEHIMHVIDVVGDDFVSLGSDWDGAITTPRDMRTCLELPRLVQALLSRGLSPDSIRKLLGRNFLRALRALRG